MVLVVVGGRAGRYVSLEIKRLTAVHGQQHSRRKGHTLDQTTCYKTIPRRYRDLYLCNRS